MSNWERIDKEEGWRRADKDWQNFQRREFGAFEKFLKDAHRGLPMHITKEGFAKLEEVKNDRS